MTRLSKAQRQRRAVLAYERVTLLQRLSEVDTEIRVLDVSVRPTHLDGRPVPLPIELL